MKYLRRRQIIKTNKKCKNKLMFNYTMELITNTQNMTYSATVDEEFFKGIINKKLGNWVN